MNPVSLQTLITRVRQRLNAEGAVRQITDWEITDCLNVSWATELYDLVRQSVGDQYFRKTYSISTITGTQAYDLPGDFLALISVDVWLASPGTPGATQLKVNARRYMEYERNLYQQILIGWSVGATCLYSLTGQQITFQPTPVTTLYLQLNYVPVSPQMGGGPDPTGTVPMRYGDVLDDIDGWAEVAVLDAAKKCAMKLKQFDLIQAINVERADLRKRILGLTQLRHAGEPERANFPQSRGGWGDGYLE